MQRPRCGIPSPKLLVLLAFGLSMLQEGQAQLVRFPGAPPFNDGPLSSNVACEVRIRLYQPAVTGPDGPPTHQTWLNLAEVQLWSLSGSLITSGVNAQLSTTYPSYPAQNCFDGNLATLCHTNNGDADPWMRITYPCPSGNAASTLKKVVVYNRNESCCSERIKDFTVEFVDVEGAVTSGDPGGRATFALYQTPPLNPSTTPAVGVYTIYPQAMCSVRIRLSNPATNDYLNIADVMLHYEGAPVAATAALSTIYNSNGFYYPESLCTDGDPATFCHTADGDPAPSLTFKYRCPTSDPAMSLSGVEVWNRAEECCVDRIRHFTLDFLDPEGVVKAGASYDFAQADSSGRASYYIPYGFAFTTANQPYLFDQ